MSIVNRFYFYSFWRDSAGGMARRAVSAVTNFIFAERYDQEPEKVASIVALGNAAAIIFIPLTLALRL